MHEIFLQIKNIVEKVQKKIFEKEKVIKDIINLLVTKFVASTEENHIKVMMNSSFIFVSIYVVCLFIKVSSLYQGGLTGLAAVAGGLATDTNLEVHN